MSAHTVHMDARQQRGRSWIWAAVIVEIIGLTVDALWHGILSPEVEPRTHAEMVRHLATVHFVLYVGVVMLVVSTVWALVEQARRGSVGIALPVAVVGAAVQLGGEIWHAYWHLQLQPNPLPELAGFVGLAVAIAAIVALARSARGIAMEARAHRGP
jgi:hypothetical protein